LGLSVGVGQELEERSQPVLIREEVLDGIWVLNYQRGLHEAVLLVLYQLAEVDHQTPWIRPETLETLKEHRADLLLNGRL
jgi:hypothetical protein